MLYNIIVILYIYTHTLWLILPSFKWHFAHFHSLHGLRSHHFSPKHISDLLWAESRWSQKSRGIPTPWSPTTGMIPHFSRGQSAARSSRPSPASGSPVSPPAVSSPASTPGPPPAPAGSPVSPGPPRSTGGSMNGTPWVNHLPVETHHVRPGGESETWG